MPDAPSAPHAGRHPHENHGAVNPPVYHASTILSPTLAAMRAQGKIDSADATTYAVHGTPGTFAFEDAVAALEGGFRTRLCGTGLTACVAPLLCYLSAGDHLLMVDTCYGPTRRFCHKMLKRMGVETTVYDPLIGGAIRDLPTGSLWSSDGLAVEGDLAGVQLAFVTSFFTEWYGWAAFHPDTLIYGGAS